MRGIVIMFRCIILILITVTLLLSEKGPYALAGQVESACTSAIKDGDKIIIPIKVTGGKGEVIEAWGFDIELKGLAYSGCSKIGCLAEKSNSFMCNQLANGNVRCGSYTGTLAIEGNHILFKLELKKIAGAKEASIRLSNFVDHLADAKPYKCEIK